MLFFSIDLETTGLDPMVHGITEFACVRANLFDKSVPIKSFYRYLNPDNYTWSTYCLRMHRLWMNEVTERLINKDYIASSDAVPICTDVMHLYEEFSEWLLKECAFDITRSFKPDKLYCAGKNFASFDLQFLLKDGFPKQTFAYRCLDVGPLYVAKGDRNPPDFETCKKRAIESGCSDILTSKVAHNALEDAMDVVHLLHHVFARPFQGPIGVASDVML